MSLELSEYPRGVEDTTELLEDEVAKAKTLEEALQRVRRLLANLKEKKLDELRRAYGL